MARHLMLVDSSWLLLLVSTCLCWLAWIWRRRSLPHGRTPPATACRQSLLKPRTPHDCPACRQSADPALRTPPHPVIPWCHVKSRRGAPKRIPTQGFACPNRRCAYYRITDAQIHALVGDGTEGKGERIQT